MRYQYKIKQYCWCLIFFFMPSFFVLSKIAGNKGIIVYLISLFILFFIPDKTPIEIAMNIEERKAKLILLLLFLLLFILITLLFPLADSGFWGGGSDMDEALEISVFALLRGEYPYYLKTYLGAPITPMPGSILASIPFVLCGWVQYQNLFWLIFLAVVLIKNYGAKVALTAMALPLFLSPTVLHNLIIGSDYLSNSIIILLCILWIIKQPVLLQKKSKYLFFSSILIGFALSSRIIFLPLLLPVLFFIKKRYNFKRVFTVWMVICVSFSSITLPFYFFDPKGFSPLHTIGFINRFSDVFPEAKIVIVLISLFLGTIPLLKYEFNNEENILLSCAILLIMPVILTLMYSGIYGKFDIFYSLYGVFSLYYGSSYLAVSERYSSTVLK